jgi:RNA polymerase sigma-32 factor
LEAVGADPADLVADREQSATSSDSLVAAMRGLDARSRDILESRWLTDEKSTLHELAARYDVSAERIRQLEKNALKKLKNAMEEGVIAA